MELNHFSHDHPLILSEEEHSASTDLDTCLCEICRTPLVGLCYCCLGCTYALHKWCADLPRRMQQHEFHPEHPLVLSPEVPPGSVCEECSKKVTGYAFGCEDCSFFIHADCASLPQRLTASLKVQKESPSELQRVEFDLEFRRRNKISNKYGNCFVCSYPVAGSMFFSPDSPGVFFHIHCAMLPKTLKHARHVHALDLAVNITDRDPRCEEFYCDSCEEERDVTRGAYYCEKCIFVCHVSCAIVGLDRPRQRILETNPVYVNARTGIRPLLPALWRPPEVETHEEHAKEKARRDERRAEDEGAQLVHVSHRHPLFLHDEKLNTVYKCDACATSIFGKTYVCNECTYYLHKWCSKLPENILHPLHYAHPLILYPKHRFKCKYCNRSQGAFSYGCRRCSFEIDVQCASIGKYFSFEGHEHPLSAILFIGRYEDDSLNENNIPVTYTVSNPCRACGYPCEGISLGCAIPQCNYYIHASCSLLPLNGKATTHRHNLSLCYSYKEDPNALEFFCDSCETERTPGDWVYVCPEAKCDIVAHIDCAVPEAVQHRFALERHKKQEVFDPPARIISHKTLR